MRDDLRHSVSRRAFLAGAGALGAAPIIGPDQALAQAAQPKRGGRLRMALAGGGPSDTLDPATIIDAWQQNISYQCRNTLVELLPTLQPGPELAGLCVEVDRRAALDHHRLERAAAKRGVQRAPEQ